MDEIKQRLTDASQACIVRYEQWREKATDAAARESLLEAVHELRKVAARLEIELAVSERRQNNADPIPIPAHRASRRGYQENEAPAPMDEEMAMQQGGQNRSEPRMGRNMHIRRQGGASGHGGHEHAPAREFREPREERSRPSSPDAPVQAAPSVSSDDAGDEAPQKRGRPLSLRRSAPEGESSV